MVTVGEHPNVLSLIGACTKTGNFELIFIDVLRAVSFPLSSFFVMINPQLCNTNSSTLECNFCLRTLIFNFVAILEPVLVIVTLAPNGCLLDQLKKNRENPYNNVRKNEMIFTPQHKVKIARDVACGMLHLASKKVRGTIKNSGKCFYFLEDYLILIWLLFLSVFIVTLQQETCFLARRMLPWFPTSACHVIL